jgi:hypothetical protein
MEFPDHRGAKITPGRLTLETQNCRDPVRSEIPCICMPGTLALARTYPLCCAQHKWYYVEFRIMVSSGDELEQDGGFSMDRPT